MIYLDYNATTPVDEEVLQVMLPYFTKKFGNAASGTHLLGWQAKDAVEDARNSIAQLINCTPQEIYFTSGATEGLNTAIKGVFYNYQSKGKHIVTVKTEHKAVLDTCKFLEKQGATVTYLDVDSNGLINLQELEDAINDDTILVAIMLANNETGVIQPIKEIAKLVHQKDSILCCDTTQAFGKLLIDVDDLGIDILTISGHKIYAPKGIGVLYLRRKNPRVSILPLLHGGNHERGIRSGTLNVPSIIALAKALEIAYRDFEQTYQQQIQLRTHLERLLCFSSSTIIINCQYVERLTNTINCIVPIPAEHLIKQTKTQLAFSTGSACSSSENMPSHVLLAMGVTPQQAKKAIRLSIGKYTTLQEIETAAKLITGIYKDY